MNLPIFPNMCILENAPSISYPLQRNRRRDKVKLERVHQMCRRKRRGAAVVEFAIVAPLFFLLVFGMIEFGRVIMVKQIITNASREGARVAVLDQTTHQEVVDKVNTYLDSAKIHNAQVTTNPYEPSTAGYDQPVTVTVSVPFSSISWLPKPWFFNTDTQLQATTVMRRETVE
jgi:Flp pilus assembly protein TadG